jgi:hypothetical protein
VVGGDIVDSIGTRNNQSYTAREYDMFVEMREDESTYGD